MNIHYGSIHIKNVEKFIVPGNNIDERKLYTKILDVVIQKFLD